MYRKNCHAETLSLYYYICPLRQTDVYIWARNELVDIYFLLTTEMKMIVNAKYYTRNTNLAGSLRKNQEVRIFPHQIPDH